MNFLKKLQQIQKEKQLEKKNKIFLDILQKNSTNRITIENLHQEILLEITYSLRNSEEKLKALIEECYRILLDYQHTKNLEHKETIKKEFLRIRKEAEIQKWKFIVQRECLGFVCTEELEKKYKIPDLNST